jgi:hypothetical protein
MMDLNIGDAMDWENPGLAPESDTTVPARARSASAPAAVSGTSSAFHPIVPPSIPPQIGGGEQFVNNDRRVMFYSGL